MSRVEQSQIAQRDSTQRATDGCVLRGTTWSPTGSTRAHIVLMHGYGEHLGRYHEFAEFLARLGYCVSGFDARGHGRSDGQRGHVSYFDRYVEDLHDFTRAERAARPNLPLFVLGHSNGGLIAVRMIQSRAAVADGLILSSPLVALQPSHQPIPVWIARYVAKLAARMPLPNGIKTRELTHDQALIEATDRDRLSHHWTTPGWYVAAHGAMSQVFAQLDYVQLPVLVLEGARDPLVVPDQITRMFNGFGNRDKELVIVPNAYHEVLNESGRRETYQRIDAWLSTRSSAHVAA